MIECSMVKRGRSDFVFSVITAVVLHVVVIFAVLVLIGMGWLFAKPVKQADVEEEILEEEYQMAMVYLPEIEEVVEEDVMVDASDEVEKKSPQGEQFAVVDSSQESTDVPVEADRRGAFDSSATSDDQAVAGELDAPALSGKDDPSEVKKTFDSKFSAADGPTPQEARDGEEQSLPGEVVEKKAVAEVERFESVEKEVSKILEKALESDDQNLTEINRALIELEKQMAEEGRQVPEKVRSGKAEKKEARDGMFRTEAEKTRVVGVLSAKGKGSLNVKATALGRYEADILRRFETSWQMETSRRLSLIAPGRIHMIFQVDRNGVVSGQRKVSMRGASITQWGIALDALRATNIPKMPKEVVRELGGESLEIPLILKY